MMSESTPKPVKAPTRFWIVSVLALLWNLLGFMAFVAQLVTKPEDMSSDTAFQELMKELPSWYFVVFGIAVIFGSLGCVGLLMKAKWALPVFVVSLGGILGQQYYSYFMSNTLEVVGFAGTIFPTIVLLIAISLIFFSRSSIEKGWLK